MWCLTLGLFLLSRKSSICVYWVFKATFIKCVRADNLGPSRSTQTKLVQILWVFLLQNAHVFESSTCRRTFASNILTNQTESQHKESKMAIWQPRCVQVHCCFDVLAFLYTKEREKKIVLLWSSPVVLVLTGKFKKSHIHNANAIVGNNHISVGDYADGRNADSKFNSGLKLISEYFFWSFNIAIYTVDNWLDNKGRIVLIEAAKSTFRHEVVPYYFVQKSKKTVLIVNMAYVF